MIRLRHLVSAAALAATACASAGKLRDSARAIQADVEKVRQSGAAACAPADLALAEANLLFAEQEIAAGGAGRAKWHLEVAAERVRHALESQKRCAAATPPSPAEKPKPIPVIVVAKPDRDGDGIPDAEDACPDLPGPKETRGCPVIDTDGDGISDHVDKCPAVFGMPPDGCPKKYTLLEVKKEKIEIKQQVRFANGKANVQRFSFPLLVEVAQVLNDYPNMQVSVEGHTDDTGGERANLRLSQQRADAVRDFLVRKGIAPTRLKAIGYGPSKPIASNKTAKGKAKNRRTEFNIVR